MHHTCANLLRKTFDCEDAKNLDHIIRMVEIELILGRPCGQTKEGVGRYRHVRYEDVSGVDFRRFYEMTYEIGVVEFDWIGLKNSELGWVLSRPDMFPRFSEEVSEKRLSSIGQPGETTDAITTLPVDILFKLIPFLDIQTYLAFTSTCRTLRQLALKEFQPHTRKLVLNLPWSTPLLRAYNRSEHNGEPGLVHPETSPPTGDWLLYLSHIHRTNSMRERRRIWQICEEIKYQHDKQKAVCNYMRSSVKRKQFRNMMCTKTIKAWSLKGQMGKRKLTDNEFREIQQMVGARQQGLF